MTPYEFGKESGADGEPFCPESVFIERSQVLEYTVGFLAAQPENPAALAFLEEARQNDMAVDAAQYTPLPGIDF